VRNMVVLVEVVLITHQLLVPILHLREVVQYMEDLVVELEVVQMQFLLYILQLLVVHHLVMMLEVEVRPDLVELPQHQEQLVIREIRNYVVQVAVAVADQLLPT
jgi:hypothetical protein